MSRNAIFLAHMLFELLKGHSATGLHVVVAALYGHNLLFERFRLRFKISLHGILQRSGRAWKLHTRDA